MKILELMPRLVRRQNNITLPNTLQHSLDAAKKWLDEVSDEDFLNEFENLQAAENGITVEDFIVYLEGKMKMRELKCCVDGCRKTRKRFDNYCSMHRARLSRSGRLDLQTLGDKLKSKCEVDNKNCWNWMAYKNSLGYGRLRVNGVKTLAHRASYVFFTGDIPSGLLVCHRCDNPSCINPEHLFLGTAKDNHRDAVGKGRINPIERAKDRWIKCKTLKKN